MKRNRGAQANNKNALKHGIYSAAFKSGMARGLDRMPLTDLSAEIELIRVMQNRYLESVRADSRPPGPEAQLSALRAVTLSAHAITSLLRLQARCSVDEKERDKVLEGFLSSADDEQDPSDAPE